MKNNAYKRLPGKRRTLGRWYTLWLGEDHLLSVESTGYSEDYTRFYLGDIRGLICRRTGKGTFWSIFSAVAAAVLLLGAATTDSELFGGFCAIIAGCCLLSLLINFFRGPTCVCHLLMPLGSQRLPALGREKQVDKLRKRIGPLISVVQGTFSAEEPAAAGNPEPLSAAPFRSSAAAAVARAGGAPGPAEAASCYLGGAHWALFSLLIVDACFSMFQMTTSNRLVAAVASLLQLFLFAFAILALVKQRGSLLPDSVKRLVWGALGTLCTALLAVQVYGGVYAFSMVRNGTKGQDLQQFVGRINALDHPAVAWISGIYIVIAAFLGIVGLLSMLKWQRRTAKAGGSLGT